MTLVRRASIDDLDALVPLFDAYRRFYGQPGNAYCAGEYLRQRMRSQEAIVLMAERGGTAIGFALLYPTWSSVRMGRLWILNDLFVDERARRRGVARRLLDEAAVFARGDGAVGIVLETARDNTAARALYRAAGWHEEATQWYGLSFAQAPRDQPLFSYGTLQDEDVQRRLFGRTLGGTPDELVGYRLDWLEHRDPAAIAESGIVRHPIVRATGTADDRVPGMLFRLTAAELARADEYEAGDYRRVQVQLASGASAWLYVEA